jgi:transcription-repair coupling factor (superfamily II helicase)
VQGLLDEGWTLRGVTPRDETERRSVGLWSLHVITDAEIFGWSRPQPRRRGKPTAITPEQFFADLQPGDYVVHIDHGIGIFQGLIKLTLEGIENEYLQVAYASGDKLYVPIHQADRLKSISGGRPRAGDSSAGHGGLEPDPIESERSRAGRGARTTGIVCSARARARLRL